MAEPPADERTKSGSSKVSGLRVISSVAALAVCASAVVVLVMHPGEKASASRAARFVAPVTEAVRNDLGELKWIKADAVAYTPLEAEGQRVYEQGGCSYCHSQYARPTIDDARPWGPVSALPRRWGPPAEAGEHAYDRASLLGPGGVGPDLSREGLKYSDEWHLAHFWNPPMVTQNSVMGGVSGLFDSPPEPVKIVKDAAGIVTLEQTPATRRLFDFTSAQQVKITPNADGLLFVPTVAQGKYPVVWTPNDEFAGPAVKLVAETREIEALIAYIQKLGMNRGRWREAFEPKDVEGASVTLPRSDEVIAHGKEVYERRCIACHGVEGNGNGPASTFLYRQRPRNFTLGVFKFRTVKGQLPTDADLMRTISRGVRGTAMPAWFELPLDDRLAVMQYVKYVLAADRSDAAKPEFYFVEEPPGAPLRFGAPPAPSADLLTHGHEVFLQAKCWECHGKAGKGDGEKAAGLKDDWGFPIRPANLTVGQFKSGPRVDDLFRTISTGLSGSPMPAFIDSFPEADRWALAYYVLSLSAWNDPLTAAPVPLAPQDRAALDDPKLDAAGPQQAYAVQP